MSYWTSSATNAGSGVLTLKALNDTFEAIRNQPPDPCSLGHHVVSPDALRRGGWTNCANCYRPVNVEKRDG